MLANVNKDHITSKTRCDRLSGTLPGVQRKASPHFSNVVMTAANLDLLRCTPVFRDVGKEEKREGCIFGHFVSFLTHRGHMLKRHQKVHFA